MGATSKKQPLYGQLVDSLREKIERDTSKPEFILTKWGVGYYFTDED